MIPPDVLTPALREANKTFRGQWRSFHPRKTRVGTSVGIRESPWSFSNSARYRWISIFVYVFDFSFLAQVKRGWKVDPREWPLAAKVQLLGYITCGGCLPVLGKRVEISHYWLCGIFCYRLVLRDWSPFCICPTTIGEKWMWSSGGRRGAWWTEGWRGGCKNTGRWLLGRTRL